MIETWKCVKGYEDYYLISNLGNIKSVDRVVTTKKGYRLKCKGKLLSLTNHSGGYLNVSLYKGKKRTVKYLHRLVAEAFIDNPKNKEYVNHIDGNKKNNNKENLEWVSHRENVEHAFEIGLKKSKNKYRGVRWKDDVHGWEACFNHRKKYYYVGVFSTPEEAKEKRTERMLEVGAIV